MILGGVSVKNGCRENKGKDFSGRGAVSASAANATKNAILA